MKKVIIILALFSFYQFSFSQNGESAIAMEKETGWILPDNVLINAIAEADSEGLQARVNGGDIPRYGTPEPAAFQPTDTVPIKRPDTLILMENDSVLLMQHDTIPLRDSIPGLQQDSSSHRDTISRDRQDSLLTAGRLLPDSASLAAGISQTDTLPVLDEPEKPRGKTPRGAIIRSAIIPGWGQAYNNRYWKIPIVYGALGGTGAVFAYNIKYYKKIRFAYTTLINKDTANFINVAPELMPFIESNDLASLRLNRNAFRKNIDYSVLFFLFFWGLNVLDATVDAHLKGFNVSDDLSLKVKPLLNTSSTGFSLVLDIHKGRKKMLFTQLDL